MFILLKLHSFLKIFFYFVLLFLYFHFKIIWSQFIFVLWGFDISQFLLVITNLWIIIRLSCFTSNNHFPKRYKGKRMLFIMTMYITMFVKWYFLLFLSWSEIIKDLFVILRFCLEWSFLFVVLAIVGVLFHF